MHALKKALTGHSSTSHVHRDENNAASSPTLSSKTSPSAPNPLATTSDTSRSSLDGRGAGLSIDTTRQPTLGSSALDSRGAGLSIDTTRQPTLGSSAQILTGGTVVNRDGQSSLLGSQTSAAATDESSTGVSDVSRGRQPSLGSAAELEPARRDSNNVNLSMSHEETSSLNPTSSSNEATETIVKPEVVHEASRNVEQEVVKPIINRDRQQTEIRQVVQPITDKQVNETQHSEQVDATENRVFKEDMSPETRAQYAQNADHKDEFKDLGTERQTTVAPTEVNERLRRNVVEEVQPVIEREVVNPSVVTHVKPVHETVILSPKISSETRAPIDAAQNKRV